MNYYNVPGRKRATWHNEPEVDPFDVFTCKTVAINDYQKIELEPCRVNSMLDSCLSDEQQRMHYIENAVVLLSYPEKAFGNPKALRAFLSTDVSLSVGETLSYYTGRWPIEIFFRQCKDKLALDSYQIRSAQGIRRYWLLMSMAHFMCVAGTGEFCSFEKGYHRIESIIQTEKYQYLFQCVKESNDFDAFMKLAG